MNEEEELVSEELSGNRLNITQVPKVYGGLESLVARRGYTFVTLDFDCYPEGTDVLTSEGWVSFSQLKSTNKVVQVDPNTLRGSYTEFTNYISRDYEGVLCTFRNRALGKLRVTPNHRMLWTGQADGRSDKWRRETKASDGVPTAGSHIAINTVVEHSEFITVSERELVMAVLLQADGSKRKEENYFQIEVKKPRKVERLTEILGDEMRRTYKGHPGCYRWNHIKFQSELLDWKTKRLNLKRLSPDMADIFVRELTFWDGTLNSNSCIYGQMNEETIDEVQAYLVRSGYKATKVVEIRSTNFRKEPFKFYKLRIRKATQVRLRPKIDEGVEHYKGKIYCVSVPSGYLLVRQNGHVFVSGNCLEDKVLAGLSKDPAKLALVGPNAKPNDGYIFNGSQVAGIGQPFLDEGYDPYNSNADVIKIIKKKHKGLRGLFKAFTLAFNYGARPKKLQKILLLQGHDKTLDEVEFMHRSLTDVYAVTGEYVRFLERQLKRNGGWVLNGVGMPVCVPEGKEKDVLNRVVQSSGHIILMMWINIYMTELQERGVQFWPSIVDWHDASTVEVAEGDAEEVADVMNKSVDWLNDILKGDVPMTGKAAIHKTFAEDKCDLGDVESWYGRYVRICQERNLQHALIYNKEEDLWKKRAT